MDARLFDALVAIDRAISKLDARSQARAVREVEAIVRKYLNKRMKQ